MKIVSSYHDYYDVVLKHHTDHHPLWQRDYEILEDQFIKKSDMSGIDHFLTERDRKMLGKFAPFRDNGFGNVLFLCLAGKVYPIVQNGPYLNDKPFMATMRRFDKSTKTIRHPSLVSDINLVDPQTGYFDKKKAQECIETYEEWEKYRASFPSIDCADLNIKYNTPVLILSTLHWGDRNALERKANVFLNPCLKDMGFQSIMDPYVVFQEIETFMTNQLARDVDVPLRVGSDEDIARAKGFDEYSFRTAAPGQKKLNRKKNRQRKRFSNS